MSGIEIVRTPEICKCRNGSFALKLCRMYCPRKVSLLDNKLTVCDKMCSLMLSALIDLAFLAICLNSALFLVGNPSKNPKASPNQASGACPVENELAVFAMLIPVSPMVGIGVLLVLCGSSTADVVDVLSFRIRVFT